MSHWNQLPAPAIELTAQHVASLQQSRPCHHGPDAARHVLPLVSRSWRDALRLWPQRWEQVIITAEDLPAYDPSLESFAAWQSLTACHARLLAWFAQRGCRIRRLAVLLQLGGSGSRVQAEAALKAILVSLPGLESLRLEVDAPLVASNVWRRAAGIEPAGFPQLRHLALRLAGSPLKSQAENAWHAERALVVVGAHGALESVSVRLCGVRLLKLPRHLADLSHLHSLELCFDPQMPTLPLPGADAFARGLPASLRCLVLEHPPLQPEAALELGKLPGLQAFRLVWQEHCELANMCFM